MTKRVEWLSSDRWATDNGPACENEQCGNARMEPGLWVYMLDGTNSALGQCVSCHNVISFSRPNKGAAEITIHDMKAAHREWIDYGRAYWQSVTLKGGIFNGR